MLIQLCRRLDLKRGSTIFIIGRMSSTRNMQTDVTLYDKQYINGKFVKSDSKEPFIDVYDSNTGKVFAKVVNGSPHDTEKAIDAAFEAFEKWSSTSLDVRKGYLARILEEYTKRIPKVSQALQRELGAPKPLADSFQSMTFSMHVQAALNVAETFEWTEDLGRSIVVKEPIGVVGAITPWNWPLNQIGAKLAPALLAGCTFVLKPSEVTPINAYIVAEAVHAAGLPAGVFNMVHGTGPRVGQPLATHPKVDMVSFTGSTPIGRRLHALGSSTIKRVRTELGGKSACILLEDASPKQIVMMATNVVGITGQSCNALSRMLAPRSRYDEICELAKNAFDAVRVVNGTDASAEMGAIGPLASKQQFDKVRRYISTGIEEGATLVTGGLDFPDDPTLSPEGYFVRPTIFSHVTNEMTIAREEIFGPVLCIIPYDTVDEAVRITNDTIYGLKYVVCVCVCMYVCVCVCVYVCVVCLYT